jgi:hypothetical protein
MATLSKAQLFEDLIMALLMAALVGFVAAIPLGLLGLVSLTQTLLGRQPEVTLSTWLAVFGVVMLSYLIGASTSALAVFLLRPLRGSWVGWALTGAVVGVLVYGTIGLLSVVFYEPVGRTLMTRQGRTPSRQELAHDLPTLMPIFALIGVGGGLYWRRL